MHTKRFTYRTKTYVHEFKIQNDNSACSVQTVALDVRCVRRLRALFRGAVLEYKLKWNDTSRFEGFQSKTQSRRSYRSPCIYPPQRSYESQVVHGVFEMDLKICAWDSQLPISRSTGIVTLTCLNKKKSVATLFVFIELLNQSQCV